MFSAMFAFFGGPRDHEKPWMAPAYAGRIVIACAAIIVAWVWALGIGWVYMDRHNRLVQAGVEQENITRLYAEHVAKTLQSG